MSPRILSLLEIQRRNVSLALEKRQNKIKPRWCNRLVCVCIIAFAYLDTYRIPVTHSCLLGLADKGREREVNLLAHQDLITSLWVGTLETKGRERIKENNEVNTI